MKTIDQTNLIKDNKCCFVWFAYSNSFRSQNQSTRHLRRSLNVLQYSRFNFFLVVLINFCVFCFLSQCSSDDKKTIEN